MSKSLIRMAQLATYPGRPGKLPASAATIWRWVREGKFPKPFKLGESVTVWNEAEVDAFISSRALPSKSAKAPQ